MEYYKNNANSLIKESINKSLVIKLVFIILIISLFILLKTEIYDYQYIYVSINQNDNLLNLNTNVILDYNEEILKSTIIEYNNKEYKIKNIIIDSYNTDTYGNIYSNIILQTEKNNDFVNNSYVKVKLLKNKQRLIYKIKNIIL